MSFSDLPKACGRDHVKVLTTGFGWTERKHKRGHIILTKSGVRAVLSIPDHKEVKLGLLSREFEKAGIDDCEYAAKAREII